MSQWSRLAGTLFKEAFAIWLNGCKIILLLHHPLCCIPAAVTLPCPFRSCLDVCIRALCVPMCVCKQGALPVRLISCFVPNPFSSLSSMGTCGFLLHLALPRLMPAWTPAHPKFSFSQQATSSRGDVFILWSPVEHCLCFSHDHQNGKNHNSPSVHCRLTVGPYPLHTSSHLILKILLSLFSSWENRALRKLKFREA